MLPAPSRLLIVVTLFCLTPPVPGETWPGFRGYLDAGDIELPESFNLEEAWNRKLGTGYSSLAVADGRVFALFTDAGDDWLGAFEVASGKDLWRLRFDAKYAGHDGSDDGPLSTPRVVGDRVYALGPKGQLVAAHASSGAELWRIQLSSENSSVPYYGYAASPLVVGDLVVLAVGGENRAVVAFDAASGETRWAVGTDSVTYQSVIEAELAGRRQLVAVTDQQVLGLAPESGEVLWSRQIAGGSTKEESAHATALDDQRVLINLNKEAVALSVAATNGSFTVEELWRSRVFANTDVLPILAGGRLFGFTGRILNAVDPENGEILWRSREIKGDNLSLVGGHLAAMTSGGELVVAKADPAEYREAARLKLFERGDYGSPAWADGLLVVRNQGRLAAVRLTPKATPVTSEDVEPAKEPKALEEPTTGGPAGGVEP